MASPNRASRGFASLGRHHRWNPVPGLARHRGCPRHQVAPASSTLGLSQTFGGLLFQTARLSCFIQTPPMGFKEHERTMSACGPDQDYPGDSPIREYKSGTQARQAEPARFRCEEAAKYSYPLARPSEQTLVSACHSPLEPQAARTGGGHIDRPALQIGWSACATRAESRGAAHRTGRKQLGREEDASTNAETQTDHGNRPSLPNTTAPLPERHPSGQL